MLKELPPTVEAESLPARGLNFFSPEIWQGETYCWSAPKAAVNLPKVSPGCCIRLDARPTGGWLARRPRLYLNGMRIPAENVTETDGIVEVMIREDIFPKEGSAILSWDCVPFLPSESGLADRRRLGVALIRATIEPRDAVMSTHNLERAA